MIPHFLKIKQLLNLFFPKQCINCNREGSFLCEDCLSLIEINSFQYCLCEKLEKNNKCENCKNKYLDKVFSATSFKNKIIKKAIHKLKYSYIKELSVPLAYLMIRHLQVIDCQINNDFFLVPVPLSDKKKRTRGFNQSEEIAKIISEVTGLPLLNCVKKIKDTKSQTEMKKNQRQENVKNVFFINENVENKNIILIDDVYTTGATMEEVAKKLKESKANIVWGITVARETFDL